MFGHRAFCTLVLAFGLAGLAGCGGGTSSSGSTTPPPPTTYTIGGTVSGLTGTGLVLQDNSGNNLTVSATGAFTFSTSVASGAAYSVTVLTQPTGQSCTVTSGSGTANANVTNVQVSCSNLPPTTYTIGGTVSGLTGTGLVLQDNSGNNLTVSATGAFTFSTSVASGAAYSVTVLTQPAGQSCTVTNGSGTASANVSNVQVTCSTTTYTIGGTVSGLIGTGLILQDNGGNNLAVSASGSFTFSTAVASGTAYSVTVLTQPSGQSCTVTSGSGTGSANVTNVQVACSNVTYTIGGTVSGLAGTGLVLQNNGGNNLSISANGAFTFSNSVARGATYSVTVLSQPTGQSCTVTSGSGTASANVANVQVACTNLYTIGGTVSGLAGTGLVLQDNGGNNLSVSANGTFTFSNSVASGAAYSVTVLTQPTGQSCTVTNGSGTATANVTNVQIVCTNLYATIGGTVSGLTGTGLVLQDNGGNNLSVSANGTFSFSNSVARGATYSVTVLTQPTGQSCAMTNGSGTASANVTNVQITCTATTYTIGGTISGLTSTGLVLQDNGGNNLAVSASSSFTFSTAVAGGAAYSVTILTQPTGQSCTIVNGSGTATANVTNVLVTCVSFYTVSGMISGLTGTGLVLQDNGGNNLSVSTSGGFTFSTAVASGAAYSVTVLSQPTGQFCTVTNGSGTASTNMTNVQVACSIGYSIGGTVSGLTGGQLVLQDNSGNNQTVSANGSFTFSNSVASGAAYNVTILNQPIGQSCTVANNGSGTASANVTNVQVTCVASWTWMSGSSIGSQLEEEATPQGTAASSNVPGGRYSAVSWSDASGNLWLFGGKGGDRELPAVGGGTFLDAYFNELWKFDPALSAYGEWALMGGVGRVDSIAIQPAVYGTQGTAASANIPGGRTDTVSWNDASGNVWLFGGTGVNSTGVFVYLNDLWKFDSALGAYGEWTWMGGSSIGSQPGVYGTQGTAASTNVSGARAYAVSWTDSSGKFWLFGGEGYDSTGVLGELNDLWKFDPALGIYGEWTWMGGSSTDNQLGVYGTQGTAASANIPGGRYHTVSWSDASGNRWLFGGEGYDSTGTVGMLNDLWKFNPALGANGEWTWMGGSSTVGSSGGCQPGVYGTVETAASANIPGGRSGAVSWSDGSGNLWLFGGDGCDSTGVWKGYLNDLWKFNPALGANGEWTWMGGSSTVGSNGGGQSGVYGTLGTAASTNVSGGRAYAVGWTDSSGKFWLFGGYGFDSTGTLGELNDLWQYQP